LEPSSLLRSGELSLLLKAPAVVLLELLDLLLINSSGQHCRSQRLDHCFELSHIRSVKWTEEKLGQFAERLHIECWANEGTAEGKNCLFEVVAKSRREAGSDDMADKIEACP
jgi:hypothetical protein